MTDADDLTEMTLSTRETTLSYAEIARKTGLSRSHVSRVLRGRSGGSSSSLRAIAAASGLSVDALVERAASAGRGYLEGVTEQ